ncbi:MAG: MCE family protein [Succinimonas sp.]|nr:MCE family protein [Succinimonas sp.]
MDKILTVKKEKLYSFIWTVPIVALIIAGTLIYRSHFNKGPEITLILSKADGIEAGKTAIKALSVNVGKIESITLSPDRKNVIATARMDPGTEDLIREDSRFWIQKVRIDRQGVTGLDTLLSGYYIELSPGNSPRPSKMFSVLDDPPIATDDRGLFLTLHSRSFKRVSPGSILKFKGIEAGYIIDANYDFQKQIMTYRVFVSYPFSKTVDSGTKFWISSGITFSMGPDGLKVDTDSLENIISGGISFDNIEGSLNDEDDVPVKNDHVFTLYNDRTSIVPTYASSRTLDYVILLPYPDRGLQPESPVFFQGVQVGVVKRAPYFPENYRLFHNYSKYTAVLISIQQERYEKSSLETIDEIRQDIEHLIREKNLTASVENMNMLTGKKCIDLLMVEAPGTERIVYNAPYHGYPVIPSLDKSLNTIQDDLSRFTHKLATLPMEDLANNVNQLLKNFQNTALEINALTSNINAIADKLHKENISHEMLSTLKEVQSILASYNSDSALYRDLSQAVKELNSTLKGVKPVVSKVNEKTNSLVFSYDRQDPVPAGKKEKKENKKK